GWSTLASLASRGGVAFTPSYQLASQVKLHAGLEATTFDARISQFDLWKAPEVASGTDALWVSEGRPPPASQASSFREVLGPETLPADYQGRRVHTFTVWTLKDKKPVVELTGAATRAP